MTGWTDTPSFRCVGWMSVAKQQSVAPDEPTVRLVRPSVKHRFIWCLCLFYAKRFWLKVFSMDELSHHQMKRQMIDVNTRLRWKAPASSARWTNTPQKHGVGSSDGTQTRLVVRATILWTPWVIYTPSTPVICGCLSVWKSIEVQNTLKITYMPC
jgi:hypothetical protein